MSAAAWWMMIVTCGAITAVTAWLFVRVLRRR